METKKTKKTKAGETTPETQETTPAIPAKPKKPNAWTQFVKENISKMKGDTPQMRMKLCSEVLSYDFRTPFWSNGYCYSLFGTETLNTRSRY